MDDFRQISVCLPAWLTAENEKRAGAVMAPASATGQRQGEEKPATASHERMNVALRLVSSRDIGRAKPHELPRSARPISLVLIWSDGHATAPRQQLRHERDDAGTTRIRGSS